MSVAGRPANELTTIPGRFPSSSLHEHGYPPIQRETVVSGKIKAGQNETGGMIS